MGNINAIKEFLPNAYQHIKSKFMMGLKNKFTLLGAIPEDIDIERKGKNLDKAFNKTAKSVLNGS